MFRLGFKKNEEKDILIRAITEVQELRAELSDLKERLLLIMPDRTCVSQESFPAEMVEKAEGITECRDDIVVQPQPDSPGEIAAEPAVHGLSEEAPDQEDQPECINPEIGTPNGDSAGESSLINDTAEDDQAGGIDGREKKEWAVVSLVEAKRPWWRLWGPKNHLVRRSI